MIPNAPDAVRSAVAVNAEYSLDELIDFEVLDLFARSPEGLAAGAVPLAITVVLLHMLAAPPLLVPWALAVALVLSSGNELVQIRYI